MEVVYYEIQAGEFNSVSYHLKFRRHQSFDACIDELERCIKLSNYVHEDFRLSVGIIDECFGYASDGECYVHQFIKRNDITRFYSIVEFKVVQRVVSFKTF